MKNLHIEDIARIQRLNQNGRRIAPADVQALADTVEVMLQAFNAHSAADAGRSLLHERAELKSLRLEVLEAEKQLQSKEAQIKELRSKV